MINLPKTDLRVFPLCLGGNVFGWSADRSQSVEILDAFTSFGGNFIDTADMYSSWVDGNQGGESETIIGEWIRSRGNRSSLVVATKVGRFPQREGLSHANIVKATEESLARLGFDFIDILYAHKDDFDISQEEYLAAFDSLVKSGKVRYIAASNFTGNRLQSAAEVSNSHGFSEFIAVQNLYNLLDRVDYESDTAPAIEELGIAGIPHTGLAKGFLTGKYRQGQSVESVRIAGVSTYMNESGFAVIERLEQLARDKGATMAQIALAWLRAQPGVCVPIASARNLEQLHDIIKIVELEVEELGYLTPSSH